MAFARSVKDILPGLGAPSQYVKSEGVVQASGATTTTTLTVPNSQTVSCGLVRIKATALGGASQITGIKITATDGTTTNVIYEDVTARAASGLPDLTFKFRLDIDATSVSIAITLAAVNTVTTDLELAGNP